eukprot:scaffold26940_cov117-Phaeocystis_antarctica.AAC.22
MDQREVKAYGKESGQVGKRGQAGGRGKRARVAVVEHAQALLGDLNRRRHEVVRAKDVECAKRSAGVLYLVEVAHAAPGALAVEAA